MDDVEFAKQLKGLEVYEIMGRIRLRDQEVALRAEERAYVNSAAAADKTIAVVERSAEKAIEKAVFATEKAVEKAFAIAERSAEKEIEAEREHSSRIADLMEVHQTKVLHVGRPYNPYMF
jgi:hypothetical protein